MEVDVSGVLWVGEEESCAGWRRSLDEAVVGEQRAGVDGCSDAVLKWGIDAGARDGDGSYVKR